MLAVAGCSDDAGSSDSGTTSPETSVRTNPSAAPLDGYSHAVDVGGRSLHLTCSGEGAPTLVLESGEGEPGDSLDAIRTAYEDAHVVCSYDRANVGASDAAPTPRKAETLTNDLHELLREGDVPGDYVLVGHSAGGLLVQAYARAHPDEVAGVVALNPVPPLPAWSALGFREMSPPERAAERTYYSGDNGESLDYREVSDAVVGSPAPRGVPFHLVISTIAQCASPEDICGRTYPAYEAIMRAVSRQWPGGRFTEVKSGHEIHVSDLSAVQAAVDDVLSR